MRDFSHDPFFQYPQTNYPTSQGEVAMPILYFDDSNFMAAFFVDIEKAQPLLLADGFEAIKFGNRKALAIVAFYQYRHTSIGAYNEVGVAIAAHPPALPISSSPLLSLFRHPDNNSVGFCIIDLPVTTPAACAAGREIWGYPKFVTAIDFSLNGKCFSGVVTDPSTSTPLLKLSGTTGLSVSGPLLDLVLYSRHHGTTLRATANTRGGGKICLPGSVRLEVSNSSHRMAENLRALGLANAKPVFVSHTHALQLRLNAGAVLP